MAPTRIADIWEDPQYIVNVSEFRSSAFEVSLSAITPPTWEADLDFLPPTVLLNASLTTPLLKAIGPGEDELAACEFLWLIHPEMYKEEARTFEASEDDLRRYRLFLRSIDDITCEFRHLVNDFLTFLDPTEAPYPILPLLAPLVGIEFNFDVPQEIARSEIVNAIFLWERKGTRDNFADWDKFITGFRVQIREFYKEVIRSNVWGQSYHSSEVPTREPIVWRETWETFLSVPSYSLLRSLPPTVWEEHWEQFVPSDPYATVPHLHEHHRTNTWDGNAVVPPFYNFHFEPDINYGVHGFSDTKGIALYRAYPRFTEGWGPGDEFTLSVVPVSIQTTNSEELPGFLFRNHIGVYVDFLDSDIVDEVDTEHTTKPLLATSATINGFPIHNGVRVIFTALTGVQEDDNFRVFKASVDMFDAITWTPKTPSLADIGIDFTWFGTPYIEVILRKLERIFDLITFYGVVSHLFWRIVSIENAEFCQVVVFDVVPRVLEGWGKNIGDDTETPPPVERITETVSCDGVIEDEFECFGDTYNIDIGSIICCLTDSEGDNEIDDPCGIEGRLATFALCSNDPDRLTNDDTPDSMGGPWLTFYPAKYWSHQVDDILQTWVPDIFGILVSTTVIPAEYSLAELFINPLIGTGTGQGIEIPTTISDFIAETCFNGEFETLIIGEEWDSSFTETLVIDDNWEVPNIFTETLVISDNWNLPAFFETPVFSDNWNYSITFNETLVISDNWNYSIIFNETLVFGDDWDYSITITETFVVFDDWEDNLPMLIPDDQIWLDGNNGPMGNSPVQTWLDRSGAHNDGHQNTVSNKPDHVHHDPTYNNFGTVVFDGINDYMTINDNVLLNTDQFSLFFVGHWTGPTNFATLVSKVVDQTFTTGGWGLIQPGLSGNVVRFFVDNINTHYIDYTLPDNTPVIIRATYDQTKLRMSVNGVPVTSAFSMYGGGTTNSSNEIYVGAHVDTGSPSGFFPGTVAEFIYYSRILTPQEEFDLLIYLSEKYNIAVTTEFDMFSESWEFTTTYSETLQATETFNFSPSYSETQEVNETFDASLVYVPEDQVLEAWDLAGLQTLLVFEDWEFTVFYPAISTETQNSEISTGLLLPLLERKRKEFDSYLSKSKDDPAASFEEILSRYFPAISSEALIGYSSANYVFNAAVSSEHQQMGAFFAAVSPFIPPTLFAPLDPLDPLLLVFGKIRFL